VRVAVLGAGLQGACVAMELAAAGVSVDLYERTGQCVGEASAQNEGKIHLGYVFANDPTLRTARAMVNGAAVFAPLLRRWLGESLDPFLVSSPFNYVVHRDSMLTVDEFSQHLIVTTGIARATGNTDYFGLDVCTEPTRLSQADLETAYDPGVALAVFRTAEIAIDPEALAAAVRHRLGAEQRIRLVLDTEVTGVELGDNTVGVEFESDGEVVREGYDQVVNTSWDSLLQLDATAGLSPPQPWLHRIKHYLRVRAPQLAERVPSTTIVLGPFGDVVNYGDGDFYLSWYPSGMSGMSSTLRPRWPIELDEPVVTAISHGIVDGLVKVLPGLADLTPADLAAGRMNGGVIFAWGSTDIDDPDSGLHHRHQIGPRSYGLYHAIDTGKLTMAPLFARELASRILKLD
jgi:glycine/D-amino acid oxidase-like deaminating enzyme